MKSPTVFLFSRPRVVAVALLVCGAEAVRAAPETPDARPAKVSAPTFQATRGIALSNWIGNARRQRIYRRDMMQLKRIGFERVRIPIDPAVLSSGFENEALSFDFSAVDSAVDLAISSGLAVVLDMHPRLNFMHALEQSELYEANFVRLWGELIRRYKRYSTKQIAFELLNEPHYYSNPRRYNELIARVVAEIRRISSAHTLLIGGPRGSGIQGLTSLDTFQDPNIVYAFHFYEPYIITHQGAWWGFEGKAIRYFRNVPYPSKLVVPERPYAPAAPDSEKAASELKTYLSDSWDDAQIRNRIHVAVSWAAAHHVRVACTEFGVLRTHSEASSRYRWIRDVRKALESDGIGWDLWDYTDLFGIVQPVETTRSATSDSSRRFGGQETGRRVETAAIEALFR